MKVNKENEYSEKPDTKVKVECEAQDLFNAHDFDITIDLGMGDKVCFGLTKMMFSRRVQ